MIALQNMCARIGAVSGCGIAGNLRRYYPVWILIPACALLIAANIFNVGANVYGMAGALSLFLPLDVRFIAVGTSAVVLALTIFLRYRTLAAIFKWLALSLFVYVIALAFVHIDWRAALWHTLIPTLAPNREMIILLFAILGTTISPYMFFWQASQEAEEVHGDRGPLKICRYQTVHPGMLARASRDTHIGMTISNVISFAIIALTAATVYRPGGTELQTLADAAVALEPVAGPYATLLFAIGLFSAGLLCIPVLAGSAAYVVAELRGWPASLDRPFNRAPQFYAVMAVAVLIGLILPWTGLSVVEALFYTALINGIAAPLLIMLVVHMAKNPDIVGPHRSHAVVHSLGISALFFMTAGALFVILS
jgi:Mn2+/Fe2+ NRAMP family transporter